MDEMDYQPQPLAQMQLIKPEVAATGHPTVDAALARLTDSAELPVAEQVEVFDEIHRRLQDALADTHS